MNEEALILRMEVNCIAGRREAMWALYEEYVRMKRLHVPVWEILAWKGRAGDGRYNAVPGVSSMVESGA